MDLGGMFSNILGQREPCPSCGELNSTNGLTCASCDANLRADDPTLSVVGGLFKKSSKVPLSQSENYVLLKKITTGIQNGTVSDAEYRVGVKRLLSLVQQLLKTFEAPEMREATRGDSQIEKIMKRDLVAAFQQFERGIKRMEAYSTSGDLADVRDGAALTERAFHRVDAIEDRAIQSDDRK